MVISLWNFSIGMHWRRSLGLEYLWSSLTDSSWGCSLEAEFVSCVRLLFGASLLELCILMTDSERWYGERLLFNSTGSISHQGLSPFVSLLISWISGPALRWSRKENLKRQSITSMYYGSQNDYAHTHTHFSTIWEWFPTYRWSVAQGLLAGIILCHSVASKWYFLWTQITHKNSLGIASPIACTSCTQKNCCRIICVILFISGLIANCDNISCSSISIERS